MTTLERTPDGALRARQGRGLVSTEFIYSTPIGIEQYRVRRGCTVEYRVPGDEWRRALPITRRVPFRFAQVVAAMKQHRPILLVENESIAEALALAGGSATALAEGLDSWCDDYSNVFRGADVVVAVAPGKGDGVVAHLTRVARRTRVLDLSAMRMLTPPRPVSTVSAAAGRSQKAGR